MKLKNLNLSGKGGLLDEFEMKNVKGGYYTTDGCRGEVCAGYCPNGGGCIYTETHEHPKGCYCVTH